MAKNAHVRYRLAAPAAGDPLAQAAHIREPGERIGIGELPVTPGEPAGPLPGDDHRGRDHDERGRGDEHMDRRGGPGDHRAPDGDDQRAGGHVAQSEAHREHANGRGNRRQRF